MDKFGIKTDRIEEMGIVDIVCPFDKYVYRSPYLSNLLAFTVQRKIEKLESATDLVMSSTNGSFKQLLCVRDLASLIVKDKRLGDYLDAKVLPRLFQFLEDEEDSNLQYYSATILSSIVSSNIGTKVKDESIPYLLNLIPSPDPFVQIQALNTLYDIANVFPDSCDTMIKSGALELLESLFTKKENRKSLLERGGALLTALCGMKPYISSDEITKFVRIINIAMDYDSELVLIQVCLALAILSDRKVVETGTEFIRLINLINHPVYHVVITALRTIGNYVRCGNYEDIQFMIEHALLPRLGNLLSHEYTIVRTEACWIISNIIAVANKSHIQEMVDLGLIDTLVTLIENDELEVKEVAARAIINVICGCDKKQFGYSKERGFALLNEASFFPSRADPQVDNFCSNFQQLDIRYRGTSSEILKPDFPPKEKEEITSIRAPMANGNTPLASPPDPLTDVTEVLRWFWVLRSLKQARSC